MNLRVFVVIILLLLSVSAWAGRRVEVVLNDGTTISGEVMYYENGTYEIKSDDRGMVNIASDDIFSVNYPDSTPSGVTGENAPETARKQQLEGIMERKMGKEKILDIYNQIKN